LLENPLYYAAKWGGFDDIDGNQEPDQQDEWDKDGDGVPDTYFYVINPLKLEAQLNETFADIAQKDILGHHGVGTGYQQRRRRPFAPGLFQTACN
jgi:type IV pilus assembly protein PilY1